jgi:hypothetical protein
LKTDTCQKTTLQVCTRRKRQTLILPFVFENTLRLTVVLSKPKAPVPRGFQGRREASSLL